MGLEKAIEHGKEHRKPYYKAGKYDKTCRPHGSCPWCQRNRQHKHLRAALAAEDRRGPDCMGPIVQGDLT